MTVHHEAHRARIAAGVSFEWDTLPPIVERLPFEVDAVSQLRFWRVGASHRGVGNLRTIRALWAYNVNQEFLRELCTLEALEDLHMERVTATDLSAIRSLPKLERLSIVGATKIEDLSWLPSSSTLRALSLENFKRVGDLSPLAACVSLRALGVEGGVWSPMRVTALYPLASLHALEYLFLTNLRVDDGSLQPLHGLSNLKALQCARYFTKDQFFRLAEVRPGIACDWFNPEHWA